jgi:methylated-DNA-[protein]-cysteine S-methyltransferase
MKEQSTMSYVRTVIDSPVGHLTIVSSGAGLCAVLWDGESSGRVALPADVVDEPNDPVLVSATAQFAEYFAGTRTSFDLPLDAHGTPFQHKSWDVLRGIPFGETISYGEQARRLGSPNAFRAVGAANGRNPIAIVVPCHRVVGSNGALTGFAGGMDRKAWLLRHESGRIGLPGV